MPRPIRQDAAPDMGTTATAPAPTPAPDQGQPATVGRSSMITEGDPAPSTEAPATLESAIMGEDSAPEEGQPAPQTVPDKLQGKSPEELARMYYELERRLGQQGEELGRLRQVAAPKPPETDDDPEENQRLLAEMLASPKKFMKTMQERFMGQLGSMAQQAEVQKVKTDNLDTLQDPGFVSWARENVPMHIIRTLDNDPQALRFVLKSYKTHSAPAPVREAAPKPTGIPSAPRGARSSKPVFSAEGLQRLFIENPAEYEARLPEIQQAYVDGRVK